MKKFAVFGNPIKQSLSPLIHQDFARQADIVIQYERLLSTEENFKQDALAFFADDNVVGCNVTAPFKEQAFQLVDEVSDSASLAKAVNTIYRTEHGTLAGDNTDGIGLVLDIKRFLPVLTGLKILLLGAGGAARGTLYPLLKENVDSIKIANRTFEKALQLSNEVNNEKVTATTIESCNSDYDIVINSTSAGLTGSLPNLGNLTFEGVKLTYDMVYKKHPTDFLLQASNNGSELICDGLGMLVGQAAQAFKIWTGFTPNTSALIKKLRDQMP